MPLYDYMLKAKGVHASKDPRIPWHGSPMAMIQIQNFKVLNPNSISRGLGRYLHPEVIWNAGRAARLGRAVGQGGCNAVGQGLGQLRASLCRRG